MLKSCIAGCALALLLAAPAQAHFGMVIPSNDMISDKADAKITIDFAFAHPMEAEGMNLVKPEAATVTVDGKSESLLPSFKAVKIMGHDAFQVEYTVRRPGIIQIAMTPVPYWEPAEDLYIIHYTKAYVAAFGDEEGWDQPVGMKSEIVPLTRPFGNYAGNTFQGLVLLDGKPVPGCRVQIEYYNEDGKYAAPNKYMVSQNVKTGPDGIFTYSPPFAGWWGFKAMHTADQKIKRDGVEKDVILGGVLWSRFLDPVRN